MSYCILPQYFRALLKKLHIANTFFEDELLGKAPKDLKLALSSSSIYQSLSEIPLYFMDKEDALLVRDERRGPHFYTFDDPPKEPHIIESWGASNLISDFAKKHGHHYLSPDLSVVKKVHAKNFILPPFATLLENATLALDWIRDPPYPKVLKSNISLSAKGHFIALSPLAKVDTYLKKANYPLRGEPWLNRCFDFSTQWFIDKGIHYLGACVLNNNQRGSYLSTIVGNPKETFGTFFPYLEKHKKEALLLLQKIKNEGYFGNVGLDAFIYDENKLAISEINARKTMSYAALQAQRKRYPEQTIRFTFKDKKIAISTDLLYTEEQCKR